MAFDTSCATLPRTLCCASTWSLPCNAASLTQSLLQRRAAGQIAGFQGSAAFGHALHSSGRPQGLGGSGGRQGRLEQPSPPLLPALLPPPLLTTPCCAGALSNGSFRRWQWSQR